LDTEWNWVREDPLNWSLTAVPGSLQINPNDGYVVAHTNSNLLLRAAPEGNFQIETQVLFTPKHNFEFAGLIIYQSDSNFVQAGREFCSSVDCIGKGLYISSFQKGRAVGPNVGYEYIHPRPIALRLSRRDNTYTFEVSEGGNVWFTIGTQTNEMDPTRIGLTAGQNLRGDLLPAVFEYFEVRSLK
jgi:beta-xylosidase